MRSRPRAHRHTDIRRGEGGGVVDAIADHESWLELLLDRDRRDLVGRVAIRKDRIDIERGSDRLRSLRAVARKHDDPRNAGGSQALDGARRLSAQLIGKQDRARRRPVHDDENGESRPKRGLAKDAPRPGICRRGAEHIATPPGVLIEIKAARGPSRVCASRSARRARWGAANP